MTLKHLPADIRALEGLGPRPPSLLRSHVAPDAEDIVQALKQTGGNKAEAARRLGISRRTIYRKIEAHGISFEI
jgi:transcriptional regulator of acetoin/glycerol metabolism